MRNTTLSLVIVAVFALNSVWGQSPCNQLLQQGVYDYYSSSTSSSGYQQFVNNFCGSYSQYLQNQGSSNSSNNSSDAQYTSESTSHSYGANIGIPGIFNLGGSYTNANSNSEGSATAQGSSQGLTHNQISALGQLLCTDNNSTDIASNAVNNAYQFIDQNALDAYNQCINETQTGLQVFTTIRSDQQQVSIELDYTAPRGAPDNLIINDIEISPPGAWNCSGILWNIARGAYNRSIGTDSIGMSCTRNVSAEPFMYQNQSLYAVESTIVIITAAETITRNFVPLYAAPEEDAVSELNQEISNLTSTFSSLLQELEQNISSQAQEINDQAQEISDQAEELQQLQNNENSLSTQENQLQNTLTSQVNDGEQLQNTVTYQGTEIGQLQNNMTSEAPWAATLIGESCNGFYLSGTSLFANCAALGSANYGLTSIDLSNCVGNSNGVFVCQNGGQYQETGNAYLETGTTILQGDLENDGGNVVYASVDLNTLLYNHNGQLTCDC